MSEIFKALAQAQAEFEGAYKNHNNPAFRAKYADLGACIDAVRPALNKFGIFLTQPIKSVEGGVIVETLFAHTSGQTHSGGELFVPADKQNAQGYGSAISYGRRYSLLAATGVAPEDDDGNAAVSGKPAARPDERPFVITDVLNLVEDAKTTAALSLVWGEWAGVAQANGAGAYQALKAACNERKVKLAFAKTTEPEGVAV